jgi:predicted transcriptional regulator
MPQPKTRVMQKANLSYTALQDCLKKLQELELVDKSPDSQKYATTQKGTLFLAKWMQLQEVLNPKEKLPIKTQKRHF